MQCCVYMQQKKIQHFKSLGRNGNLYMEGILKYLENEWQRANETNGIFPNRGEWKIVTFSSDTPRQSNAYDCGVFVCLFADLLSIDIPLSFSQAHINDSKRKNRFINLDLGACEVIIIKGIVSLTG